MHTNWTRWLRSAAVVAVATAAGVAGAVSADSPAQAAGSGPTGRVVANGGLVARSLPTTFSTNTAVIANGRVIPLACQVTGTVIFRDDGSGDVSNIWYRLPASDQWVSQLYVTSRSSVPYCGPGKSTTVKVTGEETPRYEAPTTRSNSHAAFSKGSTLTIACRLQGRAVDGNRTWYNTEPSGNDAGLWIPARYAEVVGAAPPYCTS